MRRQRDIIEVIDQHERDLRRLKAALARKPKALEDLGNYLPLTGGELSGGLKVDEATVDGGQLRLTSTGDPNSVIFRNDGADFWLLASDTEDGTWNTVRPFRFNLTSGEVYLAAGARVADGTAASPGLRLTSNAHGLYRYDASNVGIAANGGAAIIASQSGVTVMGDFLYFNGTTATEYIQFADASNWMRIVLDGGEQLRVNTSGQILALDGSAGAPSHSFLNDSNSGFLRQAENNIGVALGAVVRAAFQVPTANGSTGLLGGGTLLVGGTGVDVLGSTAGNIQRRATFYFDVGGNNSSLEVQAVRDANGSDWTTASLGIRRVTDATSQASLWFYQSRIGVNKSGPQWTLEVAGTFGAAPSTTTTSGFIAHWHAGSGSSYQLYRYTSSKRYKKDIDYDTDWLADLELKPSTFLGKTVDGETGKTTWAPSISFIAEDAAELDERLAVFDEKGRVSNFDDRGYLAILAAKDRRREAEIKALEERVRVLESA